MWLPRVCDVDPCTGVKGGLRAARRLDAAVHATLVVGVPIFMHVLHASGCHLIRCVSVILQMSGKNPSPAVTRSRSTAKNAATKPPEPPAGGAPPTGTEPPTASDGNTQFKPTEEEIEFLKKMREGKQPQPGDKQTTPEPAPEQPNPEEAAFARVFSDSLGFSKVVAHCKGIIKLPPKRLLVEVQTELALAMSWLRMPKQIESVRESL